MKKSFALVLIVFFSTHLCGQIEVPKLTSPAPPSPNAASLGKFGETPVNLGTGIPSVSIPIYEIKSGQIAVPISLSYHAGGIKVEETASWVGLGWALDAGGVVTRVQRGLQDEGASGFKTQGYKVSQFLSTMTATEKETYIQQIENGNVDAEPDIFCYNFAGYSGKFCFGNDGQIFSIPRNNLKISYVANPDGWEIIAPDGNKYLFTESERTVSTPYSSSNGGPISDGNPTDAVSSWYLKKVTDIYSNTVDFNYDDIYYYFKTKAIETKKLLIGTSSTCEHESSSSTYYVNEVYGKRLRRITFTNGDVNFIPSIQLREDLGDFSLAKIQIKNSNTLLREFVLSTSYFTNTDNSKRLRLDAFTEVSGPAEGAKYSFEYNSTPLPGVLSNSQDYWGYYNGATNQEFVSYTYSNGTHGGADKEPNSLFTKACVLEKINYPTGGYSQFEFENNTVGSWQPPYSNESSIATLSGSNANAIDADVYFDQPFTVTTTDLEGQPTLPVRVAINEIFNNPLNALCYTYYTLQKPDGTLQHIQNNTLLDLAVGSYVIHAQISSEYAGNPNASFTININKQVLTAGYEYSKLVGGLRIKKQINQSLTNNIEEVKFFKYQKFGTNVSSGTIGNMPEYYGIITEISVYQSQGACTFNVFSSTSNYPLITTSGSSVIYANVTTEIGDNAVGGKIENSFTSNSNYPDYPNSTFPFPPNTSFEWKRALPILQTTYKKTASGFQKISEETNTYLFTDDPNHVLRKKSIGLKIGRELRYIGGSTFTWIGLQIADYPTVSEFFALQTKKTRTYNSDNPNVYVENSTTYDYSQNHFQPVQITSTNSKNQQVITYNKYSPDDITGLSSEHLNAKNDLSSRNVLSPILEQSVTINGTEKQKLRRNYKFVNAATPSGGTVSINALHTVELKKSPNASLATEVEYLDYLSNGNSVLQKNANDFNNIYLWDYNRNYPVAEVKNANENEVAYTSFEADGSGGWVLQGTAGLTTSITGKKSWLLNSQTITKGGLTPNKTYVVSYWSKNGQYNVNNSSAHQGSSYNGWVYYEHEVQNPTNNTITVTGAGYIDELRLYPRDAQMTTYCYDPLAGVTEAIDVKNNILYYEYDGFKRLYLIRDLNGKVVKKFCYNYTGQLEDCDKNPFWQPTGITRCQPCPANNSYSTNLQEHQEIDVSPQSPTYNTYRWVEDGPSQNCIVSPDWQNTATIRCKKISGINTGEQEQSQIDANPCSPTFNQSRWTIINTNCSICPKPANWQSTGNYRCAVDGNNNNTGYREHEEKDMESCSLSYNQLRWVVDGINCTICPKPQNWQSTGNVRCVKDESNNNTGYQEREERNIESCSINYNATRWVNHGYNPTACPVCNASTCTGAAFKCINGTCEQGEKVFTTNYYEEDTGYWYCVWHYEWSDGSWSQNYEQYSTSPCTM